MKCTAETGCIGTCLQGRLCERSFTATRRVLGLTAEQVQHFESKQGGALIEDGHAIPDPPPVTPDEAAGWLPYLVAIFCAVALAAAWGRVASVF